jgi:hypothetical protein
MRIEKNGQPTPFEQWKAEQKKAEGGYVVEGCGFLVPESELFGVWRLNAIFLELNKHGALNKYIHVEFPQGTTDNHNGLVITGKITESKINEITIKRNTP